MAGVARYGAIARCSAVLAGLSIPLILAGCATPPKDPAQRAEFDQTNDPLEPMNRAIFDFNDKAYRYVLFPIARGYKAVFPASGAHRHP